MTNAAIDEINRTLGEIRHSLNDVSKSLESLNDKLSCIQANTESLCEVLKEPYHELVSRTGRKQQWG